MQLDRDKFKAWLESKPANAVVGLSCQSCQCPVAEFLVAMGEGQVEVDGLYYGSNAYRIWRSTPRWAAKFIDAVDGLNGGAYTAVTAQMALAILSEVEAANVPA